MSTMIVPIDDVANYSRSAMVDYVRHFRKTQDHKESTDSGLGKQNIIRKTFKFPTIASDEIMYKTRDYRYPGFNFTIISLDFLEEHIKPKFKVTLDVMTLEDLLNELHELGSKRTFDIYFNGVKQNIKNIRVIFDYDKIIFITKNKSTAIDIMIRNHIADFYSNDNTILITSDYKNKFNKYFKIVFANGKKTNNFTSNILPNGDIEVVVNDANCTESSMILLPEYTIQTVIPTANWIDIKPNCKKAISVDNIFAFMNGTLVKIEDYDRKGNSLFLIRDYAKYTKELIIIHDDKCDDVIQTYSKIDWYKDNINREIVKELNSDAPSSFLKYFSNYNEDISATNADLSNMNSSQYNTNVIRNLILYDQEVFKEYIERYLKTRTGFSESVYINANEYGWENYVRKDTSDIPLNAHIERFAFPMVLIVVDNPEYRDFKVYIDGVALYRHMQVFNKFGKSYIYIRQNKFLANTFVEIEFYNVDKERYEKDVMINADGVFTLPKDKAKNYENLIDVYQIGDNEELTKVEFTYDSETGNIDIGPNKQGLYKIVINNAIMYNEHVINSRHTEVIEFDLPHLKLCKYDKEYYRVYKNGKLIPRKFYNIEFPTPENGRKVPFIHVDCHCFMSEQMNVEFVPYRMKEVYSADIIDDYGKIKIDKKQLQYPLGVLIDSLYLNGRKLHPNNIIQNSSTGMELINILSKENFCILLKEDYDTYTNFLDFTEAFSKGNCQFDNYIKDTMVGSRINIMENNVLEKDFNIMRDLYWDLYNEYLKTAIVDFGSDVPDYIAIKYADLVNYKDMIYIDSSEQMNHWMPLDASQTYEQNQEHIADIYENMMNTLVTLPVIHPYIADKDEIAQIEPLADKNVVVIDLSQTATNK